MVDIRTEADLEELLAQYEVVVLDFWAPWCPACRKFLPVFEAASSRHPDLAFARVNTQEAGDLAEAFEVSSLPSLLVIRERILVAAQAGYLNDAQMDELFRQVRALDMDVLRRQMEDSQTSRKGEQVP